MKLGKATRSYPEVNGYSSVTYSLLQKENYENLTKLKWYVCEVCLGALHEPLECPTKKRLDRFAADNNDKIAWGKAKWNLYYKEFTEQAAKQARAHALATESKAMLRSLAPGHDRWEKSSLGKRSRDSSKPHGAAKRFKKGSS